MQYKFQQSPEGNTQELDYSLSAESNLPSICLSFKPNQKEVLQRTLNHPIRRSIPNSEILRTRKRAENQQSTQALTKTLSKVSGMSSIG